MSVTPAPDDVTVRAVGFESEVPDDPTGSKLKGKRKFIVAMVSLVMGFALAAWKMDGATIAEFWPWQVGLVVGLFGGTNVVEHFAKNGGR